MDKNPQIHQKILIFGCRLEGTPYLGVDHGFSPILTFKLKAFTLIANFLEHELECFTGKLIQQKFMSTSVFFSKSGPEPDFFYWKTHPK